MAGKEICNGSEISDRSEDASLVLPSSSLTIDPSVDISQIKPQIAELCRDLFKGWAGFDDSCFSVEPVSGGVTNLLLKVSVREDNWNNALLTIRVYGPNTEYIIDRNQEMQAVPYLSAAGFGPKLLGIFGNGTVQSFIHARTLSPSDMSNPKLAAEIAKQLSRFHLVEIPGPKEPQLWNTLFKFFNRASVLKFDNMKKQNMYATVPLIELSNAILHLKGLTEVLDAPVVYAHNDLLSGNFMLSDDEEKLFFIDFEYGSYSYRGYDIGNHFNEYAGLDCDYSLYPGREAQNYFFRHYLHPDNPDQVSEAELEALYVETNAFALASHLYWALWALIQANVSPIGFDYFEYFFLRYNEYKRRKESVSLLVRNYMASAYFVD